MISISSCDIIDGVGSNLFRSALSKTNNKGIVKVFILAGQSNMVGAGTIEANQSQLDKNGGMGTLRYLIDDPLNTSKYKHLVESSGQWTSRNDVWIADLNNSGPLTLKDKTTFGPELQFAHVLGDFYENPVLIIKIAWGGKSLYNDFRPPSSGGTVGPYYTMMIERVNEVLNNIGQHIPDYNNNGYEIVGFGWHQGWNDRINQSANNEYQKNCVNLINDLRAQFKLPDMPFVIATTGMSGWNETHPRALSLMNAQLAVPNDLRLNNKNNVAAIDTRDFWRDQSQSPANQSYHWNRNAETYFLIGESMGKAMIKLLPADDFKNKIIYEAENNTDKFDCTFASMPKGYSASGYMNYGGNGAWIEWNTINVPADGNYTLTFRYAVGSSVRRSSIIVNGMDIGTVAFGHTGGWTHWKRDSIVAPLKKGINTIRVKANTRSGGPNLDRLEITSVKLTYEAEDNTNKHNCSITSAYEGYSGTGFIDYGGNGAWIEWNNIKIAEDGDYSITYRYAVGSSTRRSSIIVNGINTGTVAFNHSGGWTSWKTDSIVVSLKKGINTIRVMANTNSGGPNLDKMEIELQKNKLVNIDAVYFAQNHVLEPENKLFKLVSNLKALIKVHVISSQQKIQSPDVHAVLSLNGDSLTLNLNGPDILPTSIPKASGVVDHKYENSFTTTIPKEWIKPGLKVFIKAGSKSVIHDNLKIGAPNKVMMTMFDVNYFKSSPGDYNSGWKEELQSKWPVSQIELRRIPNIIFEELTIPPRANLIAARITSKQEYKDITGGNFDGEQAAALQWKSALKAAGGMSGRYSLYYINIYGVHAGGQAGNFGGVGNGTSEGILNHELGHALSLPHWGNSSTYPYRGDMYGITAPSSDVHVGPTWAFDLLSGTFIPPTVQLNSVGGTVGTYKKDPMQGGGTGDQESGFMFRHFSDYSVNQMGNFMENHIVMWNENLQQYASWDQNTSAYTKVVANNGVQFPVERNVEVISIMAGVSSATPQANIVYTPIGPYRAGLIDVFNPDNLSDRSRADQIFCPSKGCDVSLRIIQGGKSKLVMLPISLNSNADPLNGNSYQTRAVNLRASDGDVTRVELLSTPDVEKNGITNNSEILYTWIK